jgi:hypothetical protein
MVVLGMVILGLVVLGMVQVPKKVTSNDVGQTMGTTQAEKKATGWSAAVMDDTRTTFGQRVV